MTAKEWIEKISIGNEEDPDFVSMDVADVQAILDDGRRQGMLESVRIIHKLAQHESLSVEDSGAMRVALSAIREHAAKLFPKEPV